MNVGILGSGFIVPVFIGNAKNTEGYHLTGLWGRSEEKIQKFKEDVDYVTTDLNKLLFDENIDVIYVALPNALHYEYAKKALLAGKNILVEKPFCISEKQAAELFEIAEEKGLKAIEAIMPRYSPNFRWAKQQLSKLGTVKLIEGNFSQYSRRYEKFRNGEILPAFDKNLAGGALMDLGIYNIHYVCGLFGEPKDVHYYANIENGVDPSGVLVLNYGAFKATLVNAKDCFAPCHVYAQGDNAILKCNTTASRVSELVLEYRDGTQEVSKDEESSEFVAMQHELKAYQRIIQENDEEMLKEENEATMVAMRVLEKACRSAGLDY